MIILDNAYIFYTICINATISNRINFVSFLKEHPWFSLDSPSIIDEDEDDEKWFKIQYKEDNKEWFKKQYKKDFKNMIKAVGHIEI